MTLGAGRAAVAPGDGLLARRADGVLFVARSAHVAAGTWADTLDSFSHAADRDGAVQAVLDLAIDHHLEVGSFAVVTWDTNVHLVVFGDLTIVTDLPTVPRLSGAGMPTWVEHRATRVPERAVIRLGDEPVAGTDLIAGVVPAGGFQLTLTTSARVAPETGESSVSDATRTQPAVRTPPPDPARVAPVTAESSVSDATRTPPSESWDVLRDAGGAWMDDSLQLSEPRLSPAATPPARPAERFDPEVTLDAKAPEAPPDPAPLLRYVQARRCDAGHLNPPLRTRCRTCDRYIPPATAIETVPQPVLATLVLDDGRTVDVAAPVVLGRIPSAEAARLDEPGTLVALGDATVSRTHAVVTVDGWTLLAVDCGATGGTAIAPAGGDPSLLDPWVPHELAVGDTLYLGGPTKINVVAAR